MQEPAVDARQLVDLVDRHAVAQRLRDGEDAQRRGVAQLVAQIVEAERVRIEAVHADVEHAHRLLDHFGERAADRHHLADALHLAADARRGAVELAEIPARKLAHEVVERRLEERGGAARDAVRDLGQRVAERQLRRDVGERIAGRLARERARARQARVDLDDAVVRARGVERELDVALADDAEVADRPDRDRAQQLVLRVVQRLRRRDDDRVAGVDPHRIEVLHVADGDAVVAGVAHDLVLDLLPAVQALLDQHLGAPPANARRSAASMSASRRDDAAALAAERVAAAQHDRQADRADRRRAPRRGDRQARLRAVLTPISARRSTNSCRSSVSRIASIGVPSTCTPCFASMPASCSASPQLSAVWPPNESRIASTLSLTMMLSTNSGVTATR